MKLRIDKVGEKSGEYLVLHKWKYRDEKSEKDKSTTSKIGGTVI